MADNVAIEIVMKIAGCSREEAISKLAEAGNNAEAAIEAHFASNESRGAPAVATPAPPPQARSSGGARIATFSSLRASEEQADNAGSNEYYAGGEKSGIAVMGGDGDNRRPDVGNAFGAMQQHNVGEGDVDESMPTVKLTLWADGIFSVDDGVNPVVPRNPTTDPVARKFMEEVMANRIPLELGPQPVHLIAEDKRTEVFKPPPMKAFSGSGHRLGNVVPSVAGTTSADGTSSSASAAASSDMQPAGTPTQPAVDESQPVTKVQVRLADGTRLVARFNPTNTVQDLRRFVRSAIPAAETREFVLMTTFPKKVLEDDTQTLEDAKLCNSAVVQRYR
eukprot:m.150826 g.150826  ORF g.150826 m.150826 type:complete len:335 (+) comp17833_c0_seq1:170-1174(+)